MAVPLIDLTKDWVPLEDEFDFPVDDDLTDQILADLDCNSEALLRDFPKCSISPVRGREGGDVLGEVIAKTVLNNERRRSTPDSKIKREPKGDDDGEVTLISSNVVSSSTQVTAEESSQATSDVKVVARKSRPTGQQQQQQASDGQEIPMEVQDNDNDCRVIACVPRIARRSDDGFETRFSEALRNQNIKLGENVDASSAKPKLAKLSIASQVTQSVAAVANGPEPDAFGNFIKNGEQGFQKHNFPEVGSEVLRASDPLPDDVPGTKEFLSVRELAIPGQTTMRTVPAGPVSFVLVEYSAGRWSAASLRMWEQAINSIEILIHQSYKDLVFTMKNAYKWRGCGTVMLRGDDLVLLEKWRDLVPLFSPTLNTFPREALLLSEELTVMMKEDLATFKTEFLVTSLFSRNRSLTGRARVTCSKIYGKNDYTAMLRSKEGWRLCYLEGDALFMQSLTQHTAEEKFEVGCGLVTIRGGVRKPSFLHKRFAFLPWDKRKWIRTPSIPWLQHLQPIPRVNNQAVNEAPTPMTEAELAAASSSSSVGMVRSVSTPAAGTTSSKTETPRLRTRSQRLKMQKIKKQAFKKRTNIKSAANAGA